VDLLELDLMEGEESLQELLGGLLGVKCCAPADGRGVAQRKLSHAEIIVRSREPFQQ
jgi:hypothetical protein